MQVDAVARLTPARLAAADMFRSAGAASLNALSILRLVAVSGIGAAIMLCPSGHAGRKGWTARK